MKFLAIFPLVAVTLFSCFGFLASFEYALADAWPWLVGYAILGVSCTAGMLNLLGIDGSSATRPGLASRMTFQSRPTLSFAALKIDPTRAPIG